MYLSVFFSILFCTLTSSNDWLLFLNKLTSLPKPCRYVDVILQLIDKAGDFISDDIWFRVVQFVTNNDDLQVIKKSFNTCSSAFITEKIFFFFWWFLG